MASPQSIASFLESKLHYPASDTLTRLDRLSGQKIARTKFLANLDAIRDVLEPWMPMFYLPAASADEGYGLHLRPSDVRSNRLAFLAADAPGLFIEGAMSAEQLVYLALLGDEGYGNGGKMLPSFPESVAKVNKVFGDGFYQPGRHGNFQSGDEPLVMVEKFGGTVAALRNQAIMADEPSGKVKYWERAIALHTDSLVTYAGAARVLLTLGQRRQAAEYVARSLDCYHHTAYDVDLEEYFEIGRPLLREFPDFFSEDGAWQLQEKDPRRWVRRSADLFNAGEVERADKLLNDVCHGTGDYKSAIGAFRKHYQAMHWDWALALCDLRA